MSAKTYDIEAIKAAVDLKRLCEEDGVVFKRESSNWKASCPFHAQPGNSFTIHGESPQRAHCYGCGWSGDIFAYWMETRNIPANDRQGFRDAVASMAERAKIPASELDAKAPKVKKGPARVTLEGRRKPWLPKMRRLRAGELQQLSLLRGISLPALKAAEEDQRLGFGEWPLDADGLIDSRSKSSWVITDPERWSAQFRPLDGSMYPGPDGNEFKSYSAKGSAGCYPIGSMQTGSKEKIILTEGGADMLAAYQLLLEAGKREEIAVWCLFGAGVNICEEALAEAKGKRVRIFADNDQPQEKTFKRRPPIWVRPGWEAAAKWQAQFEAGGAQVDVYDLSPFGDDLKDLNDLVKAGVEIDLDHFFDF